MNNIPLPTPESLKARRIEIDAAKAKALREKIERFCKNELSPAIIKANDNMQTEIMFRLPADIPFQEFDNYIQALNHSLQEGTTQYVFAKADQDTVLLDWAGQR